MKLLIGFLIASTLFSADVRKLTWGMTPAQVRLTEPGMTLDTSNLTNQYDPGYSLYKRVDTVLGFRTEIHFRFRDGKLNNVSFTPLDVPDEKNFVFEWFRDLSKRCKDGGLFYGNESVGYPPDARMLQDAFTHPPFVVQFCVNKTSVVKIFYGNKTVVVFGLRAN